MKKLFFILYSSLLFATCPDNNIGPDQMLGGFAVNLDLLGCKVIEAKYKCSQIETESDDEKAKIIQCNPKFISENSLSKMDLPACVWNGIKISFNQLKSLTELPGLMIKNVNEAIADNNSCKTDGDKRKLLIESYSTIVDDLKFIPNQEKIAQNLDCQSIKMELQRQYQIFPQRKQRSRLNMTIPDAYADNTPDIGKLLTKAFKEAQVNYQCYTPKAQAEMYCAAITSLLTDALTMGAVGKAVSAIKAVVKSKTALKAISKGEKSLFNSTALKPGDRIVAAGKVLGKKLSKDQEKAILLAHEIGLKEGRGFYTYTQADINAKTRILKNAGFNSDEVRTLMEEGITGMFDTPVALANMLNAFISKASLSAALSTVQKEALVAIHSVSKSAPDYLEKTFEILEKSGFSEAEASRILSFKHSITTGQKVVITKPIPAKSVPMPMQKATAPTAPIAPIAQSDVYKKIVGNFSRDPLYNLKSTDMTRKKFEEVIIKDFGQDGHNRLIEEAERTIIKNRELIAKNKKILSEQPTATAKKTAEEELGRAQAYIDTNIQICQNIASLAKAYFGSGSMYITTVEKIVARTCK